LFLAPRWKLNTPFTTSLPHPYHILESGGAEKPGLLILLTVISLFFKNTPKSRLVEKTLCVRKSVCLAGGHIPQLAKGGGSLKGELREK